VRWTVAVNQNRLLSHFFHHRFELDWKTPMGHGIPVDLPLIPP